MLFDLSNLFRQLKKLNFEFVLNLKICTLVDILSAQIDLIWAHVRMLLKIEKIGQIFDLFK